jgi:hypothetical protein
VELAGDVPVELSLPSGTLRVRVLDCASRPVDGADVGTYLASGPIRSIGSRYPWRPALTTDAEGRVVVPTVPGVPLTLEALVHAAPVGVRERVQEAAGGETVVEVAVGRVRLVAGRRSPLPGSAPEAKDHVEVASPDGRVHLYLSLSVMGGNWFWLPGGTWMVRAPGYRGQRVVVTCGRDHVLRLVASRG